jgi:hypothetical protein
MLAIAGAEVCTTEKLTPSASMVDGTANGW